MGVKMKNTWQGYALASITAFLLGGGTSVIYSSGQLDELEAQHKEDIAKIEAEQKDDTDTLLRIAEGVIRLEEAVKNLERRLDDR
jgi:hypothetical protein